MIWANIVLGLLCVWLLCLWLAERRRKESCHRAHTSAVIRSQRYRHTLQNIRLHCDDPECEMTDCRFRYYCRDRIREALDA